MNTEACTMVLAQGRLIIKIAWSWSGLVAALQHHLSAQQQQLLQYRKRMQLLRRKNERDTN